jgi:hypothetical protein
MKRFIGLFLAIIMMFSCLVGCAETHVITPIEETVATAPTGFVPSPEGSLPDFLYNWGTRDFTFTIKDYEYDEENLNSKVKIYIYNNTEHDLWIDLDNIIFNNLPEMGWGTKIAAKTEREITVEFNTEKIVSMRANFMVQYYENDEVVIIADEYIDINFA